MKRNKLLIGILGSFILYCLLVAFVAPAIIKPMISEQAKNFINGEVKLESLVINPLTNSVSLKDLSLATTEGETLASFDELYVNIDLLPLILLNAQIYTLELTNLHLFTSENSNSPWLEAPQLVVQDTSVAITQQQVNVSSIILNSLKLSPVLKKDQTNNIDVFLRDIEKLLNKEETNPADEENTSEESPWIVHIANVKLKSASITLLDENLSNENFPNGISTVINPIDLEIASIHSDFSQNISLNLIATLLKGKVSIKGTLNPGNMTSKISYKLSELQLNDLNPYVEHYSLATLSSGKFSTEGLIKTF